MRFEFATATRIIFGSGTRNKIADDIAALGRHVLIVTGSTSERASFLAELLQKAGCRVKIFSVEGEPTVEMVNVGVEQARQMQCNAVVSLGGGSVIDTGKAIAALVDNHGNLIDYLEVVGKGKKLEAPPVPFVAIPTTAGTGAEVTKNAVITSPENGVKVSLRHPSMLPRLAVIDPELALTLPASVTAATGVDALTQCIEALVSIKASPLTDSFCREGIIRAARSLKVTCTDGSNLPAREDMAFTALLSGLALANAGLGAVHGFAGPIGGMCGAPHGAVCARLLPHVMQANITRLRQSRGKETALDRYHEIATLLTGRSDATAEDAVEWAVDCCRELPLPVVNDYRLSNAAFPELARAAQRASSMKGNPVLLTEGELVGILEVAFS